MTKGFSNLNSWVTTLTSTINFLARSLEDLCDYNKTKDDNRFLIILTM